MLSNFDICFPPQGCARRFPRLYHGLRAVVKGGCGLPALRRSVQHSLSMIMIFAGGLLISQPGDAVAFEGKCLLEVDGTHYLDGPCNIDLGADGSFSIGAGETTRSKYFAYVNIEPGTERGLGYWNGPQAEDRAHTDLGGLVRNGGCWVNETARVCAWRHE